MRNKKNNCARINEPPGSFLRYSNEPAAITTQTNWTALVLALAIIAATFVSHFPAIHAGYFWDDKVSLYDNDLVKADDGLYRFWFTTQAPDYWPLSATTFWIEWRLWGDNPTPFHVTNIALHALAAVALWQVLKQLGFSGLGAFLGGILFAVHPVTVESVAWITERKNVLSMPLYLLSVLAYLRFEDTRHWRWYAFALLVGTAALLAKTSVVALPIVLLLLIWWRRIPITKWAILRTVPFFLISLILGLTTIWFQRYNAIVDAAVRPEGIASRIASLGWTFWFYIYKIVLPINLAVIYPRWDIDGGRILSFVPLALLLLCLALLWHYRNGWSRGILTAVVLFIVILTPVLGLFDMAYSAYSLVADHLHYPGLPALLALIGSGMASAWSWAKRMKSPALATTVATAISGVILLLGILTWRQADTYRDSATLWSRCLDVNDHAWAAYNNRGNAYAAVQNYQQAILDYSKAIELRPNYAEAFNNRGDAFRSIRKFDLAISDCTKAVELKPAYALAFSTRANTYAGLRDYDRAMQDSNTAIEIDPYFAAVYVTRGNVQAGAGFFAEAIRDFTRAIELRPDYHVAYNNRGAAHNKLGNYDQAVRDCCRAIEINPNSELAFYNRGNAYAGLHSYNEAIEDYNKAAEIRPTFAQAYNARAGVFLALKQYDKAWDDIHKCRLHNGTPNPTLIEKLINESGRTE